VKGFPIFSDDLLDPNIIHDFVAEELDEEEL